MGSSGGNWSGRYTPQEFGLAKLEMTKLIGDEFSASQIDDFLRYVAKYDWPKARNDTYSYARAFEPESLNMLGYYDMAQDIFDKVHHGPEFVRKYKTETVRGISEDYL